MKRILLLVILLCSTLAAQDATKKLVLTRSMIDSLKNTDTAKTVPYDTTQHPVGPKFWNTTLTDLNGKTITLDNLKGKYLIINFWGEWCVPCCREVPELVKASKQYKDKLAFISILKPNDLELAKTFIDTSGMDWPQILLPEGVEPLELLKSWGIEELPPLKLPFGATISGDQFVFPTNIVILPDGKNFLRQIGLHQDFFTQFIK